MKKKEKKEKKRGSGGQGTSLARSHPSSGAARHFPGALACVDQARLGLSVWAGLAFDSWVGCTFEASCQLPSIELDRIDAIVAGGAAVSWPTRKLPRCHFNLAPKASLAGYKRTPTAGGSVT
jgi:hypothetical protein